MKKTVFALLALGWAMPAAAQGLDCTNRVAEVCDAVNDLVAIVNAEAGATVLSQSSSRAAFRPTNLYTALLPVHDRAVASGCTTLGAAGGVYDVTAGVEAWSGSLDLLDGSTSWDTDGTCSVGPNLWFGTGDDGVEQISIGDVTGVHNAEGQLAANIDEIGWQAGFWYRRSGNRGVHVALAGVCPDGVDAGQVFDPWYVGDLADFTLPLVDLDGVFYQIGGAGVPDYANNVPGEGCVDVPVGSGRVDGLVVELGLGHTWLGDIVVTLTAPDGTRVVLIDRPGHPQILWGSATDLDPDYEIRLVDGAAAPVEALGAGYDPNEAACEWTATCEFAPHNPLSGFSGIDAEGDWSLCMSDHAAGDDGFISEVVLHFSDL